MREIYLLTQQTSIENLSCAVSILGTETTDECKADTALNLTETTKQDN